MSSKSASEHKITRCAYEKTKLCRVYELDLRKYKKSSRGGVLPYTFINNELYICFGRDRESGDLTDFGGTKQINENIIQCAIREGEEESRKSFGQVSEGQARNFWCLCNSNMIIIFVPVELENSPNGAIEDIRKVTQRNFETKILITKHQAGLRCFNELSGIVWLNELQISNAFSTFPNFKMFWKVRRFIYSSGLFNEKGCEIKNVLRNLEGYQENDNANDSQIRKIIEGWSFLDLDEADQPSVEFLNSPYKVPEWIYEPSTGNPGK